MATSLDSPSSLSIVVAVYQEGERLRQSVTELVKFCKERGGSSELILVEDGKHEATMAVLRDVATMHPALKVLPLDRNRGKGAALKIGMLVATGEVIAFTDADLACAPWQIKRLVDAIEAEGYDIAIGCRWVHGADIVRPQPILRRSLGRVYYKLARWIFGEVFLDTNCGLKAYRREAAHVLFGLTRCYRWAFDLEHLLVARRLKLRIKEIPVSWSHVAGSNVRIVKDVIGTLWELVLIRVRLWAGIYPTIIDMRETQSHNCNGEPRVGSSGSAGGVSIGKLGAAMPTETSPSTAESPIHER